MLGYTGDSWPDHKGSAFDLLCLPRDPEWGIYSDGNDGNKVNVFGAEYKTDTFPRNLLKLHNQDIPCAVCLRRNRYVIKMFPGELKCHLVLNLV